MHVVIFIFFRYCFKIIIIISPPMWERLNFLILNFPSYYWSRLLSLSKFLAFYWWINFSSPGHLRHLRSRGPRLPSWGNIFEYKKKLLLLIIALFFNNNYLIYCMSTDNNAACILKLHFPMFGKQRYQLKVT